MIYDYEFLKEFDSLMARDDRSEAIEFANAKVEANPESVFYREHLGIALWVQGRASEASRAFEHARGFGSLSDIAELILIHCRVQNQQRKEAGKLLTEFLRTRLVTREHLEQLASKFGKLGEYSLALKVCFHLVSKYPNSADAWYGIGFYQEKLGFPPDVVATPLGRAVLLSRCICAKIHLAKVVALCGRWQEAYKLVREIPVEMLQRTWWAQVVLQIALTNNDIRFAESIRKTHFPDTAER